MHLIANKSYGRNQTTDKIHTRIPSVEFEFISFNFSQDETESTLTSNRSQKPEKTSTLDFKDALWPLFGHSNVVFCLILVTNIKTCCL